MSPADAANHGTSDRRKKTAFVYRETELALHGLVACSLGCGMSEGQVAPGKLLCASVLHMVRRWRVPRPSWKGPLEQIIMMTPRAPPQLTELTQSCCMSPDICSLERPRMAGCHQCVHARAGMFQSLHTAFITLGQTHFLQGLW